MVEDEGDKELIRQAIFKENGKVSSIVSVRNQALQ